MKLKSIQILVTCHSKKEQFWMQKWIMNGFFKYRDKKNKSRNIPIAKRKEGV